MSCYYKKIKILGRGTFGKVYLTKRKSDGKEVVLKVMKKQNVKSLESAYNEINILKLLRHRNIIQYYEHFCTEKHIYISMQYATKGNLYEFILHQRSLSYLSEKDVLKCFSQIVNGLNHIHSKRIIHRDLKPENILLTSQDQGLLIKIADFGISKIVKMNLTNTMTGTPNYMAPEISNGQLYDEKSDIWSLGCILYELCTLERLFHSIEQITVVHMFVHGKIERINRELYTPWIPYLISRLLSIQPALRPRTKQLINLHLHITCNNFRSEQLFLL